MRRNLAGLLSQFGFGINNDLLALLIVTLGFTASIGLLVLLGAL